MPGLEKYWKGRVPECAFWEEKPEITLRRKKIVHSSDLADFLTFFVALLVAQSPMGVAWAGNERGWAAVTGGARTPPLTKLPTPPEAISSSRSSQMAFCQKYILAG